jgi:hypothetical protein
MTLIYKRIQVICIVAKAISFLPILSHLVAFLECDQNYILIDSVITLPGMLNMQNYLNHQSCLPKYLDNQSITVLH